MHSIASLTTHTLKLTVLAPSRILFDYLPDSSDGGKTGDRTQFTRFPNSTVFDAPMTQALRSTLTRRMPIILSVDPMQNHRGVDTLLTYVIEGHTHTNNCHVRCEVNGHLDTNSSETFKARGRTQHQQVLVLAVNT